VINFSSYLGPYLILLIFIIVIVTIIAMDFFAANSYLDSPLFTSPADLLIKYAVSSLEIVLVSDWGKVVSDD
jgi:hypothetical protein